MAGTAKFHPNVDWWVATESSIGGKAAFTPDVNITGTVTTTGGLTDAELRATAVPVSGTVTANLGTIGGAATAAKQPALGTAGTASTDVITVQGIASGTPLIVGGAIAAGVANSGNPLNGGGVGSSAPPTVVSNGQRQNLWLGLNGGTVISGASTVAADATSNTINMMPDALNGTGRPLGVLGFISNGASLDRTVKANATSRILSSAASTNATSAKASAGNVFMATGRNTNAAVLYLKLYNKASAPTVGTDTPVQTFALPPQANFALDWAFGRYFATGIAYAFTTGGADADTGAVGAGDILGFVLDYS